jgi:hypothetical protein
MRLATSLLAFMLTIAAALALDNNNPETWRSPNKKYAIKEAFYGEGKRVVAVFVNLTTNRSTVIKGGGALVTRPSRTIASERPGICNRRICAET